MSFYPSITNSFEDLPDELLLLIFQYLSSIDILYSFYGLNNRLSQTISGFSKHVVLGQIPFKQFNTICRSILPSIGGNIRSLVVSNDWKGVLSKIFLDYFGEKMSLIFPCLKRLTLVTFRISSLISFINALQNLPELDEIKIMSLYEMGTASMEPKILLKRIFTANNNRLTSIAFDDDSLSFSCDNQIDINYPHIHKLMIELGSLTDLHRLLTVLPQLKHLDVSISQSSFGSHKKMELTPNLNLKYFCLRSLIDSWNLNVLTCILKRIPNVEQLIIEISTDYDTDLIDGKKLFPHISTLSLTKFSYFLRFDDLSSIDDANILSSWEEFNQEFICMKSDDNENTFVLYTLPFDVSHLYLRYPVAKNKIFSDNYSSQVRSLTLAEVSPRIAEAFPIFNKCHRMERLILRIDDEIIPKSFQPIQLCTLPYLIFFVALDKSPIDVDDFKKLFEAAPNLYHLAVNYELLNPLLDNSSICDLLKRRVTHLLIGISSTTKLESVMNSILRLSSVCPLLRHLYFHTEKSDQSVESLILTIFQHLSQWSFLVSFGVANMIMDSNIVSKNIRQWVIEHSTLTDKDIFLTDYSDNTFRLWL